MSDYARTERWLLGLEMSKGMDLKLERVRRVLAALGDPQRRLRCLHVAGTNGKGSVAAMLDAMLAAAGYRTGLYTSPHLVRLGERVKIGGDEIARDEIVALTDEIRARAAAVGEELTFFEFVTVMAFVHFVRHQVDVAVIEVGLGGRLDATNVVDPVVAVITSIGLEHTRWLGSTLAAVAAEKGGIIKPGRPVVLGALAGEARAVLVDLAAVRGAPLLEAPNYVVERADGGFDFVAPQRVVCDLRVGLRGSFQRRNAAVAVAALVAAGEAVTVGDAAIRRGLAAARWPGRLEVLPGAPTVLLDGAHNPDGMRTLVEELPSIAAGRRVHVLFAVMGDKDWPVMIELLAPFCASVTVTEVIEQRAVPAQRLAEAFARHAPVQIERDPVEALAATRRRAAPSDVVLVTGSLFLVGAVYESARSSEEHAPRAV
jgi:dihydrofolate synthase/folylpolyglutamate synthase